MGQLDNPLADDVRERSAIDEDATELVDTSVTCEERKNTLRYVAQKCDAVIVYPFEAWAHCISVAGG